MTLYRVIRIERVLTENINHLVTTLSQLVSENICIIDEDSNKAPGMYIYIYIYIHIYH